MARKDITDRAVCLAYLICERDRVEGRPARWPYQILQQTSGQPFKVCYRAMERAEKRGLIEYGVSLRTGWLTDKGRELVWGESK